MLSCQNMSIVLLELFSLQFVTRLYPNNRQVDVVIESPYEKVSYMRVPLPVVIEPLSHRTSMFTNWMQKVTGSNYQRKFGTAFCYQLSFIIMTFSSNASSEFGVNLLCATCLKIWLIWNVMTAWVSTWNFYKRYSYILHLNYSFLQAVRQQRAANIRWRQLHSACEIMWARSCQGLQPQRRIHCHSYKAPSPRTRGTPKTRGTPGTPTIPRHQGTYIFTIYCCGKLLKVYIVISCHQCFFFLYRNVPELAAKIN